MDSFLLALLVLVAPAACYLGIHASVLDHWMHFWSLLILGSAPLLYICALPQGLWWVPMPPRLITGLSRLLMVFAAFALLAGGFVGLHACSRGRSSVHILGLILQYLCYFSLAKPAPPAETYTCTLDPMLSTNKRMAASTSPAVLCVCVCVCANVC